MYIYIYIYIFDFISISYWIPILRYFSNSCTEAWQSCSLQGNHSIANVPPHNAPLLAPLLQSPVCHCCRMQFPSNLLANTNHVLTPVALHH